MWSKVLSRQASLWQGIDFENSSSTRALGQEQVRRNGAAARPGIVLLDFYFCD